MKADPCLSPKCHALNLRPTGAPVPLRCPSCGGPLLKPPPVRVVDLVRERRWAES